MQSLDSSCQEADFIINDALLKLKGSSVQGSLNSVRSTNNTGPQQSHQSAQQQPQPSPSQQQQQQQFHHQVTPQSHHLLHHSTSLTNIHHLPPQPPPYLLDGADSPPDYSAISSGISDHELLAAVGVATDTVVHQHQISPISNTITSPSLLSNINSIISPSPVVPENLLSTSTSPITVQSSPSLPSPVVSISSGGLGSMIVTLPSLPATITNVAKPEKRSSESSTSTGSGANLCNSSLSSSSPSKKAKLTNTFKCAPPLPVGGTASSSGVSLPIYHQQSHSSSSSNNRIGTATGQHSRSSGASSSSMSGASSSLHHMHHRSIPSTSTSNLPSTSGGSRSGVPSAASIAAAAAKAAFFDIHDKIRELYLYLLIHEEKSLKKSRHKHRTRSFVLERLVEREKLNTIVLNLYPGNKGYSLAFYQDDKHRNASSEPQSGYGGERGSGPGGGETSSGIGSGGVSSSSNSTGGCGISSSSLGGTNGSSSRLKQTQISSNSINSNNSNTSNLLISSNTDNLGEQTTAASGDSVAATVGDGNTATASGSLFGPNAAATSGATDVDDDATLTEIMRWPYEIDDLLTSIDNEEIPIIFSDLLETRTPNVFYSGCVICQIRDFRQTFPTSSNSCDIYHVLLRPTNETLYADINQLSIASNFNSDDRLMLESQLILATAEPLCLNPDPKIGRYAFNRQHIRQIWNTPTLRRQMKKYSQISINRKRKIDQFTHNYGLELSDYLQRVRQRPRPSSSSSALSTLTASASTTAAASSTASSSFTSKLPKKPTDVMKPLRTPNLDYPPLAIPDDVNVEKYAKAYERPRETKDCMPQLIEEYILETDREGGRVYHIKLSIYQRPANSEYLGELYVDRDYREGERNGEACQFSLGTRAHANRYIQQFTEIFTEEGRKSVKITHNVPGQPPKVSCTTGMSEHRKQQQQQQQQQQHQQQAAIAAALQIQQQHPHTAQAIVATATSAVQQTQQQLQQTLQTQQIIAPALNATNSSALPGNQVNINLQGANIVGITTTGNVQHLRQQASQIFDATNSVSVQTQPQLSLSNGSLVLVQQQTPAGLSIQTATNQAKPQIIGNVGTLTGNSTLRTQLGSSVPILQAQLKAAPLVAGQQQQMQTQILQAKVPTTTIHSTNPAINALVTGFMNSANQFQQQQQQQQQEQHNAAQQTVQQKSVGNAAILSLLNSAPAAMTNTPVVNNSFNPPSAQPPATIIQQQPTHQTASVTTQEAILQHATNRKSNEMMHNLLTNNLRKISVVSGTPGTTVGRANAANLVAVSTVGLNQDNTSASNVRVTMSALASQLASPPAVMSNASFAYTNAAGNNSITLNNNNIKILNNAGQRVISASALRRDSATAAPSPGSDSNASNTSATSNLGFAMPGLSALLATSPSSGSTDQSQQGSIVGSAGIGTVGPTSIGITTNLTNQALLERLSSGGATVTNSPGLSPQQPQSSTIAKNLVQHVTSVQSPAASISPLSSPPPQPSPQHQQQQQHQVAGQTTTTTLNLQGINLSSLQGAMATFPGLQNVQVQIPGLTQPISLSLSGAGLAAAVQQHQATTAGGQQGNAQLLVSVPVTNTTQVNTIQTVPQGNAGGVAGVSPAASVAATQTVVLTNAGGHGNPQGSVTGSMLSLPIAQLVASGVKSLNSQSLRAASGGHSGQQGIVNASLIQATGAAGGQLVSAGNVGNATGGTPIQLLGTIQQRPRSIQVVGAKQLATRGQIISQRNMSNPGLKIATSITAPTQITTTANLTANPLVMTTQKLQLKLQKQAAGVVQQQQQQQQQQHQQTSGLQQQQSHMQIGATVTPQNIVTAAAVAAANQKRRRSATDVNK